MSFMSRKRRKTRLFRSRCSERTVSIGVELEAYSISIPDYKISRSLHFPRRSAAEAGERFTKDVSIGNEYNSKIFYTVREALFLLKNGLRKYIHYRAPRERDRHTLFLVGGWTDRFAGSHIHVALAKKKLDPKQAQRLARCLHSHIPFIIALTGNSPVWRDRLNQLNSNRLLLGTKTYCKITKGSELSKHRYSELTLNAGGKRKPPTLELRVPDSGVPEYILAAVCVIKAVALRWLAGKPTLNHLSHENYVVARDQAVHYGPGAKLYWNHHVITVAQYADLFFRKYKDELDQLHIPGEVIDLFKYLKKGWNQSTVIRRAVQRSLWSHRPTWERRFAKRYAHAIESLLDGNTFATFAKTLGVRLPNIDRTWLGRKEARW